MRVAMAVVGFMVGVLYVIVVNIRSVQITLRDAE